MSDARVTQSWAFIVDSVPFTKAVIAGETSLGGSESACLGLARALAARGHAVHVFVTKLADDAGGRDQAGLTWHPIDHFSVMNQFIEWDVVVSLRAFTVFRTPIFARLRLLWSEDLLVPGAMQQGVMAVAWALDHIAYVSDYHRRQWEDLQPELAPLGWVTRNGFDPACVPTDVTKDPFRIIHISRPERGLSPLLAMWPALKAREPRATLQLCRYSSMYDAGGWGKVCESYDAEVARVNAAVGGITYLGELAKPALYRAIAEAAVMWYPGVDDFAETSCIAAIEAQACGTPFVGSYKGALPETVPSGTLIRGSVETEAYQHTAIDRVLQVLTDCAKQTFTYRLTQKEGRKHVERYTFAAIAAEWEARVERWFDERYKANRLGVLRQLLHEDDHTAAKIVAEEYLETCVLKGGHPEAPDCREAADASLFCDYVIAGKHQTDEHYAAAAIQDPLEEVKYSERFKQVVPLFENSTRVLDVACGNGSFAIALALAHPTVVVHGIDYAGENIVRAQLAADRAGVGERCTFAQMRVYDFEHQAIAPEFIDWCQYGQDDVFDGLFVGEFVEHVGDCTALVDALEQALAPGATVVYTCPHGACAEMVPRHVPLRRGHVHRFHHDDLAAVWGGKKDFSYSYLSTGLTQRGNPIGNWVIRYEAQPGHAAGHRDLETRARRTRPLQRLSVGLIVKNGELDLARCLASVWPLADEIVVGDTRSTDKTAAIAAEYGARVLPLKAVEEFPDGFAGARNAVLEDCTGDWFLWIDADEQLLGGYLLRHHLHTPLYQGFVIHQHHVYLDAPPRFDIPTRLFRRNGETRFYGCVHEQPQAGDPNRDIYPTLALDDVKIAHFGYLTADIREEKRAGRNLHLLRRDVQLFPTRELGKVLLIRETVVQADIDRVEVGGGALTPRARQGYAFALQLFLDHFDDPAHKFHVLARPWYEAALQHLGIGWEMEIALGGKAGGLDGAQAKPERLWVRDHAELARVMTHRVQQLAPAMVRRPLLKTDPDLGRQTAREEVVA